MAEENIDSNVKQGLEYLLNKSHENLNGTKINDKYKINMQFSSNYKSDNIPKPLHMAVAHATKNQGISSSKLPRNKKELFNYHKIPYNKRSTGELDVSTIIKSSNNVMYWVIIEDKKNYSQKIYPESGKLNLYPYYTKNKAVNGAVYYALCIRKYKQSHKNNKIIQDEIPNHILAIGCTPSKYGKNRGYHTDVYVIETSKSKNYIIHTSRMSENDGDITSCFGYLRPNYIDTYYKTKVYNKKSKEELHRPNLKEIANYLNNYMENLQIQGNDKAPLVASILLGIKSFYNKYKNKSKNKNNLDINIMSKLVGDDSDGVVISTWIRDYLSQRIEPSIKALSDTSEFKKYSLKKQQDITYDKQSQLRKENNIIEDTFNSKNILYSDLLNDKSREYFQDKKTGQMISESPLGKMVEVLSPIFDYINKYPSSHIDVLGQFYSNFVKYNNNDGNDLGIVITPAIITRIMVKLLDIQPEDIVLDPVAGTGTFLISAMQRMLKENNIVNPKVTDDDIKNNHLCSIEKRPNMYAVLISNMLLRGDGNSHLMLGDFFDFHNKYSEKIDKDELKNQEKKWNKMTPAQHKYKKNKVFAQKTKQLKNHLQKDRNDTEHILTPPTKILMNPPYSLKKKAKGASEIDFVMKALEVLEPGGTLAAIVPQSIFVSGGSVSKTYITEKKRWILDNCIVKDIITMNPNTFYPVGTQPVIVIIQKKQSKNLHYTNLIDFSHDGYTVIPKEGLAPRPLSIKDAKKVLNYIPNNESKKEIVKGASKQDRELRLNKLYDYANKLATSKSVKLEKSNNKMFHGDVKCIHVILASDKKDINDIENKIEEDNIFHKKTHVKAIIESLQHTIPFINRISFEWIFGANYTNPTPPDKDDFTKSVADYLGFKSAQILKGRSYLFNKESMNNND